MLITVATMSTAKRALLRAKMGREDLEAGITTLRDVGNSARRVNRTVAAHAIGDTATRIAAEAGVSSIEHAYAIPDDVLRMMAQKNIYLVPTDYPADF